MSALKFLSADQKAFYDENGYVLLKDVFTNKELDEIATASENLFKLKLQGYNKGLEGGWKGNEMKKAAKGIDYTIKSIYNLQMYDSVFLRLIMHEKLLDALEDVMGTENILLHHTKSNFKPPANGGPFVMHQDYHFFEHKKHSLVAAFLHLDDSSPENGGLAVYPGTHKLGPLKNHGFVDENGDEYPYVDPKKYTLEDATPINAKYGDVLLFHYLLVHGSYVNRSEKPRRMFLLQVQSADEELAREAYMTYCKELVLRGKNVHRSADRESRFTQKNKLTFI